MRPCQRLDVFHLGREHRAIFETFSHSFAGEVLLVANPFFPPYPLPTNKFRVLQILLKRMMVRHHRRPSPCTNAF